MLKFKSKPSPIKAVHYLDENVMTVHPEDWIVITPSGNFQVLKNADFVAAYDLIEDPTDEPDPYYSELLFEMEGLRHFVETVGKNLANRPVDSGSKTRCIESYAAWSQRLLSRTEKYFKEE